MNQKRISTTLIILGLASICSSTIQCMKEVETEYSSVHTKYNKTFRALTRKKYIIGIEETYPEKFDRLFLNDIMNWNEPGPSEHIELRTLKPNDKISQYVEINSDLNAFRVVCKQLFPLQKKRKQLQEKQIEIEKDTFFYRKRDNYHNKITTQRKNEHLKRKLQEEKKDEEKEEMDDIKEMELAITSCSNGQEDLLKVKNPNFFSRLINRFFTKKETIYLFTPTSTPKKFHNENDD
ncbi:hypothetical protein KAH94_03785 [bacterium]|nr:hypothetical protein [bacterium]